MPTPRCRSRAGRFAATGDHAAPQEAISIRLTPPSAYFARRAAGGKARINDLPNTPAVRDAPAAQADHDRDPKRCTASAGPRRKCADDWYSRNLPAGRTYPNVTRWASSSANRSPRPPRPTPSSRPPPAAIEPGPHVRKGHLASPRRPRPPTPRSPRGRLPRDASRPGRTPTRAAGNGSYVLAAFVARRASPLAADRRRPSDDLRRPGSRRKSLPGGTLTQANTTVIGSFPLRRRAATAPPTPRPAADRDRSPPARQANAPPGLPRPTNRPPTAPRPGPTAPTGSSPFITASRQVCAWQLPPSMGRHRPRRPHVYVRARGRRQKNPTPPCDLAAPRVLRARKGARPRRAATVRIRHAIGARLARLAPLGDAVLRARAYRRWTRSPATNPAARPPPQTIGWRDLRRSWLPLVRIQTLDPEQIRQLTATRRSRKPRAICTPPPARPFASCRTTTPTAPASPTPGKRPPPPPWTSARLVTNRAQIGRRRLAPAVARAS